MSMSGSAMSTKVRSAIAGKDLTDPGTIHANSWLGVAEGLVGEFLAATHTIDVTTFSPGPIVNMPVDPSTISASSLKAAVTGAIAGVSTTPAAAHLDYWNAIGGGLIGQFAGVPPTPGPPPTPAVPKAQTKITVDVSAPVAQTVVGPVFVDIPGGYTASTWLAKLMTDAIGSADKTSPATVHGNMWEAVSDVLIQFLLDHYVTVISPGGLAGSVPVLGTVF